MEKTPPAKIENSSMVLSDLTQTGKIVYTKNFHLKLLGNALTL